MFMRLSKIIPRDQIIVIHASLGDIEWPGTIEHIEATIDGHEFHVCRNANKTFLEMVERRGMFPDKSRRQCTSDLKRDPIVSKIKQVLKAKGIDGKDQIIVNCMGLRAQESTDRSKLDILSINKREHGTAGRTWIDWLPIHKMTTDNVFAGIRKGGQQPHVVYSQGMTRLSCCFCIMASKEDLCTAAKLRPELYRQYAELEQRIGHTLSMNKKPLTEITGIAI